MSAFNEVLINAFKNLAGWESTNRAAHVTPESKPSSIANREIASLVGTAKDVTWTAGENIRNISVEIFAVIGGTALDADSSIIITLDTPSDAQRALDLTQGDALTTTSMNYTVKNGQPLELEFPYGLRKLSAIRGEGAIAIQVKITAGDQI